ncbi:glycosyltransferase family 1 protein [Corticibacter populi]|uniref:Glycosyltransferase family 1 protein n=1 Tax=Corticibacter populi TaxID=1550736 RepID=A0A3M6QM67_9BURK|nr:glycosyltransferase [Corticibacter populi]RMX04183.1 glycosyltransferase family 1 protein [Corticibacter populi]RZS33205.1 glycosyltransferase involved in cell wall biosynthesis [Corticibacter populi]
MNAAATTRPYRIVMVAHSHQLGGIERHVLMLSDALAERGHAIAYAGPLDGWLGEHMRSRGHACAPVAMRGMYDPLSAWQLRRFARRWRADVIHGHAQRGARYAHWAGGQRIPSLATAHATNAHKWFAKGQRIIAVSYAVQDFLLSQGFAAGDVHVVHSGVPDLGPVAPPDARPISADRPLVLAMIARLDAVKGHDIALQALARLKDRWPLRLLFAGADDTPWAQQMRTQAETLGIAHQVTFLGQRSDVAQVLASVDVLLAPSRREALCLALIEGAAAARPGIGTDIGGIPEVIVDQHTGLLVPPQDPDALANAIAVLAADSATRIAMGHAARHRYEQRFTLPAMVRGVEAQYASLQGNPSNAPRPSE